MKYLGLMLLAIIIGVLVLGPNKLASTTQQSETELLKTVTGKILGDSINKVQQQMGSDKVSQVVDSTLNRVVSQVSSDTAGVVSDAAGLLIMNKLMDSFKNLSPVAQQQFKNNICR